MHLLVRHGIQGTTVHAVGEMAGYSRGLATHRFGSKAGLFANVLQVASVDWLKRVQAAVGKRVGTEALCAATDAADQFFRERPEEVRAMYLLWFLSIDPSSDYKANLANVHNAQRRDAAHWIRAGQAAGVVDPSLDAERVAEQYVASMAGIAYQWIANPAMPITMMFRQLKEDLVARLGPWHSLSIASGVSGRVRFSLNRLDACADWLRTRRSLRPAACDPRDCASTSASRAWAPDNDPPTMHLLRR